MKKMSNKMSIVLVLALVLSLTCGCGKKDDAQNVSTPETAPVESSVEEVIATTEENVVEESSEEVSEEASVEESSEEATEESSEEATESEEVATEYEKIGEGATVFTFETTIEGETTGYEVSTDETTVGAALLALDLIGGEDSQYGLFVTTVNGKEPTSDATGTPYWAFYINGEYAPTGVDSTDIVAGATYSFVVETY